MSEQIKHREFLSDSSDAFISYEIYKHQDNLNADLCLFDNDKKAVISLTYYFGNGGIKWTDPNFPDKVGVDSMQMAHKLKTNVVRFVELFIEQVNKGPINE